MAASSFSDLCKVLDDPEDGTFAGSRTLGRAPLCVGHVLPATLHLLQKGRKANSHPAADSKTHGLSDANLVAYQSVNNFTARPPSNTRCNEQNTRPRFTQQDRREFQFGPNNTQPSQLRNNRTSSFSKGRSSSPSLLVADFVIRSGVLFFFSSLCFHLCLEC